MLNLYSKNLNGAKYQNVFFVTKTMTQKKKEDAFAPSYRRVITNLLICYLTITFLSITM